MRVHVHGKKRMANNQQGSLKCELCDKEFKNPSAKNGHMRVHSKKFKCSYTCTAEFHSQVEKDEHIDGQKHSLFQPGAASTPKKLVGRLIRSSFSFLRKIRVGPTYSF